MVIKIFISYDFFGLDNGSVFQSILCLPNFYRVEASNGIYDQIYIDEDITIPCITEKFEGWNYSTVLNAKLQGNLEGGSITASGLVIEKIRFQRRRSDELFWSDVAEIPYKHNEQLYYEAIDKYIQNQFVYQYSIIPLTATVMGQRVVSNEITANFEGVFLSDKNSNYRLFYNVELGEIEHNTPNVVLEPLNSQYPIVSYSNLDYETFDITALFLSTSTVDNYNIDIRIEKLSRQQLLQFMKNRKPKVYRDINGNIKLVTVVGNPREIPNNNIYGIANLQFQLVEIGNVDSKTLAENGLLVGLEGVF